MQIVKGDRNSQLRKDEEIQLRKMNPQGSMARKLKTSLSPVRPSMGRSCGEYHGRTPWVSVHRDTMGVPVGSHATPSQKKRLGKRERPRTRCQGPARRQNTNDDDDNMAQSEKMNSLALAKEDRTPTLT